MKVKDQESPKQAKTIIKEDKPGPEKEVDDDGNEYFSLGRDRRVSIFHSRESAWLISASITRIKRLEKWSRERKESHWMRLNGRIYWPWRINYNWLKRNNSAKGVQTSCLLFRRYVNRKWFILLIPNKMSRELRFCRFPIPNSDCQPPKKLIKVDSFKKWKHECTRGKVAGTVNMWGTQKVLYRMTYSDIKFTTFSLLYKCSFLLVPSILMQPKNFFFAELEVPMRKWIWGKQKNQ